MQAVSASSLRGRKVSFVGTMLHEEPGSLGLESREGHCLCTWPRWDHLLESRPRQGWHLCSHPAGGGELCAPRGLAGPHRGGGRGRGHGQGWRVAKASSLGGVTARGLAGGVRVPPWHTVLYPAPPGSHVPSSPWKASSVFMSLKGCHEASFQGGGPTLSITLSP